MEIINITFEDRTSSVTQYGLKKPLVYTKAKDVTYAEGEETATFTGLVSSDPAYKAITAILAQESQTVACFGDSTNSVSDALDSITGKDFFFLVPVGLTIAELEEASTWATANGRMMYCTPAFGTSVEDLVAMKAALNSENSGVFAHKGTTDSEQVYYAASMVGLEAPKTPGSYTLAMKSPNTIPLNEYDAADETSLLAASINIHTEEYGNYICQQGTSTAGTYLDITRSKYWLKYRLKEELAQLFMSYDKIPFTSTGQTLIYNAIQTVMDVASSIDMVDSDDTVIEVPDPDDLLTNDRASRKWEGIVIEARLTGAAHSVSIKFVLSV